MQKINEMAVCKNAAKSFRKVTDRLGALMIRKEEALTTIEIIVLIIVILGIVSIFSSGAGTFVTELWASITTKAKEMFS